MYTKIYLKKTIENHLLKKRVIDLTKTHKNNFSFSYSDFITPNEGVNISLLENYRDIKESSDTLCINNIFSIRHTTNIAFQRQLGNVLNLSKDHFSIGQIRKNIRIVEPTIRDAKHIDFHITSVRAGDIPFEIGTSSSGLFAEEACQIMRYIGESNNIKTLNIISSFNGKYINLRNDFISSLIWYFSEGRSYISATPSQKISEFKEFIVEIPNSDINVSFFKNINSGKFWFKPFDSASFKACSTQFYQDAINGNVTVEELQ